MSRMSEQHDDLATIHTILLGQRQIAVNQYKTTAKFSTTAEQHLHTRINTINDLLLEIEAAGVVWPDNVVRLDIQPQKRKPCECAAYVEHGFCNCIDW